MKISYYLEKSLLGLLKTKSIDEIYVIEVINDVGTCKGTFYKYYRDKYDLLCYLFKDFIYRDIPTKSASWREFILAMLDVFSANAAVVLHSFCSDDINSARFMNEQIFCDFITADRERRKLST